MQNISSNDYDLISVSELAKRIHRTPQAAYNQISAGKWESVVFSRGKVRGVLVKYPKQQDNEQENS